MLVPSPTVSRECAREDCERAVSYREDFEMLTKLVAEADRRDLEEEGAEGAELHPSEVEEVPFPENARKAFREMLETLERTRGYGQGYALSDKQRAWVRGVYETVFATPLYENLVSSGKAPRGREVEVLAHKMPKPLKPPPRKRDE